MATKKAKNVKKPAPRNATPKKTAAKKPATAKRKSRPKLIVKGGPKGSKAARQAYRGGEVPEGYIHVPGAKYLIKKENYRPHTKFANKEARKLINKLAREEFYGKKGKRKDQGSIMRMAKHGHIMTGRRDGEEMDFVNFGKDAKAQKMLERLKHGIEGKGSAHVRKILQELAVDLKKGKQSKMSAAAARKAVEKLGHFVVAFGPDGHSR